MEGLAEREFKFLLIRSATLGHYRRAVLESIGIRVLRQSRVANSLREGRTDLDASGPDSNHGRGWFSVRNRKTFVRDCCGENETVAR